MPNTLVHSRWKNGSLVFHDADDLGVGAEIFQISPATIYIGTSTNDVTVTAYGDWTVYGDIDLADEDLSVAVGKYIYLDGGTDDYIRCTTDNNLLVNGKTTVNLGVNGTVEVAVDGSDVTLATNNLVLSAGNITVATGAYIYLDGGTNDYLRASTNNNVTLAGFASVNLAVAGTIEVTVSGAALYPATGGGSVLGITNTNEWAGLALVENGVIGWNNNNVTITHSASALTIAIGGADELRLTSLALFPATDDGLRLGMIGANEWADLFLASGGRIGWDGNSVLITHSANLLTVSGGNLRMDNTDRLEFRDATELIYSHTNGGLVIAATSTIIFNVSGAVITATPTQITLAQLTEFQGHLRALSTSTFVGTATFSGDVELNDNIQIANTKQLRFKDANTFIGKESVAAQMDIVTDGELVINATKLYLGKTQIAAGGYLYLGAETDSVYLRSPAAGRLTIYATSANANAIALVAAGGVTFTTARVMMASLPAADPTNTGQLWNNAGVVNVSA